MIDNPRYVGLQRRVQQPGLRALHLAAVAAPAFRIEEEVVTAQQLRDVRLQRDQVHRIFHVAADRHRAGHVTMQQPERAAEQIDAGGDDRRPDAVVVEHQRLDQVVGVTPVIGRVDDAARARGGLDDLDVLADAFDLAENRIERMLQRAVDRIPLRRPQLVEIAVDPLARRAPAVAALQIARDLVPDRTAWVISSTIDKADYTTARSARSKFGAVRRRVAADRVGEFGRARGAAEVARAHLVLGEHVPSAVMMRSAIGAFADVPQHQQRREQQRRRVGDVPSGDVGRAAVHGLEHADLGTEVRRRARRPVRPPGLHTDPRRCRRTDSAAAACRTAPASSRDACTRRRRCGRPA